MLNKHYTKVFSTLHENTNVNLLREKSNLLVLFRNLSHWRIQGGGANGATIQLCGAKIRFFPPKLTTFNMVGIVKWQIGRGKNAFLPPQTIFLDPPLICPINLVVSNRVPMSVVGWNRNSKVLDTD